MSPSEYELKRPEPSADPSAVAKDGEEPKLDRFGQRLAEASSGTEHASPEPGDPSCAPSPEAPLDAGHESAQAADTSHDTPADEDLVEDVSEPDQPGDAAEPPSPVLETEEAPDTADLWALRQSLSQAYPSSNSPLMGSTATAEDLWARAQPDEERFDPTPATHSLERASEAEALQRLVRLNEELRTRAYPEAPPPLAPDEQPAPDARPVWSRLSLPSGRILKSILALAVVIGLAWMPVSRLLSVTSAEATINARLINVRAPIDGTVSVVAPSIAVGTRVEPGETLLQLTNSRADRQRLDDLRRTIDGLRTESASLEQRIDELKKTVGDLAAQRDAFQKGRVSQLEARSGELLSEIKGAEARLEDARKSLAAAPGGGI